jgi:hypothetical protein
MTGQVIVGLVSAVMTLTIVLLITIYVGEYWLRQQHGRSWERKKLFELQHDMSELKKRYDLHEADRHERHRGCD